MSMMIKRADYVENRAAEELWSQLVWQQGWNEQSMLVLMTRFLSQQGLFPLFIADLHASGLVRDKEGA